MNSRRKEHVLGGDVHLPDTGEVLSATQMIAVGAPCALAAFLGIVFPGWLSVVAVLVCAAGSEFVWSRTADFPWQAAVTPLRTRFVQFLARHPQWRLGSAVSLVASLLALVGGLESLSRGSAVAAYLVFSIVHVPANSRVPLR